MSRAFIIVIDSFGIGGAPDAAAFGDAGADTLGHIAQACAAGEADIPGVRRGPLALPHLTRLGLARAALASSGEASLGVDPKTPVGGAYGYAREKSVGKDTPSGHWEMAGLPVMFAWGVFPRTVPCFPAEVTDALIARCALPGILGNRHASGTEILKDLGEEHIHSAKPICYTSADSVFQIAAHEDHFGLARLYAVCETAQEILKPLSIGRVIARPFVGETAATFKRTAHRRDYTVPPHGPTLLDHVRDAGGEVISIGKIADIFAHKGIGRAVKADDTDGLIDATVAAGRTAPDGALVFTNLVDFDSVYGHRRDVAGYAQALEAFDRRIPELEAMLRPGDLCVLSADHGCDPTWPGSDHTRENIPVLFFGPDVAPADLGGRDTFADIGQTVARHLGVEGLAHGVDCLAGRGVDEK
ncbi:phosphopentomutase [Varunaivibrio sulfuroxidans]|uniref:Phosphopentomutase n=1 Tax=Varunaivibrio sulfuroxidans TaxID=1773489 RepID=A0A4R3JDY7_9PROT|nr:phosphopentomutase [Varunaivibrio sulfuroxidans]TCS63984.1 phosphopentomutase [Varunaivibrio sulfuroxidans]WES31563.1 phosphopentomutase [Varunaivibrio sulfuroxidans]